MAVQDSTARQGPKPVLRLNRNIVDAVVFFALLAALWEIAVRAFEIKEYLLPTPGAIFVAFWEYRTLIWQNGLVTFEEVIIGFLAAVVIGVAIAGTIFFVPVARRTIYPLVIALQGVPKVALAPLIIVWAGYGLSSKVIMVFLFAFFPIVISTLGGLNSTTENLSEHFRALRASRWFTFWRLQLPTALPNFIDGCKVAMPLAVIGAVVGEFVGSSDGLGNLILSATSSAKTDLTFATLLAVTALSLVLYGIIEALERFVWWRAK